MMVRIKNGVVVEIIPDCAKPVERWYGPEFASQCAEAPDEVRPGWIYDGTTFSEAVDGTPPELNGNETSLEDRMAAMEAAIQNGRTLYEEDLGDG